MRPEQDHCPIERRVVPNLRTNDLNLSTKEPLKGRRPISVSEYQIAMLKYGTNKGKMLRVALRTLSSLGYHAENPELFEKVREYLEDFSDG